MSSDSMSAKTLRELLREVANSDPQKYCQAFDTLMARDPNFNAYLDAAEVLGGLMIQAHMNDKLAFFRLHRLAIANGIRLNFMLEVFNGAEFWPVQVLCYGIAVNSSNHPADHHFLELVSSKLRFHRDAGVRAGAKVMLKFSASSKL